MIKELEVYLGKIQTVRGTGESGLVAANYLQVLPSSKFEIVPATTEADYVSAGFDQDGPIIGGVMCNTQLDYHLRSLGGAVDPNTDWGMLLSAAGLSESIVNMSTGHNKYEWVPALTVADATLWRYTGSAASGGSIVSYAQNQVFDWKITGSAVGKEVILSLIGKGTYGGVPIAATIPTITKNRALVPAFMNATMTIAGVNTYKLTKFEIAANQVIEQRQDASSAYGYGITELTKRKIKFSVTAYTEIPSVADPRVALASSTQGALLIQWGPTGSKISLSGNYSQITDVKESDLGNLKVWELSGIFSRNDFMLTVNSDIT